MRIILIVLFTFVGICILSAQNDSILLSNGNNIVGEIKSMERNFLVIETEYSKSDFQIEWDKIHEVYSQTSFLISHCDGRRFNGTITSISTDSILLKSEDDISILCEKNNIVYIRKVEKSFSQRLYASIDVGFSLTKANNLRQASSRTNIGYRADKWHTDVKINSIFSNQKETSAIRRTEGSINERWVFTHNWYASGALSTLSNTEQNLDLRLNALAALGHFIVRTNYLYWGIEIGINRNTERYSTEVNDMFSWEGYLGSDANLFNTGDLSMISQIRAYPGMTNGGRWRVDMNLDLKYDLPHNLYVKIGGSLNFDNYLTENSEKYDYVLQSGLGWEW